ncbi:MAG: SMR family transporter, partial [Pseudomonadota bacterium]
MHWLYLTLAIAGEIVGTTALKASNGFTQLGA